MKIPLAWHNLTHDRRRLVLAVLGVAFAVLLMFLQLGFRNALFDSTVAFIEGLDADLVIVATGRYTMAIAEPFPRRRLEQARVVEGVTAAEPLYVEQGLTRVYSGPGGVARPIRVAAFDPRRPPFVDPAIRAAAALLATPHTALADARSRADGYGPLVTGAEIDLEGNPVRVVGTFSMGTDFANDGTLLVSTRTLHDIVPRRFPNDDGEGNVDVGLVRVRPGADVEEVRRAVATALSHDVRVFTKAGFVGQERDFWRRSTPIGFVFGLGLGLGFVVGVVVCYQVLATDVSDHMAELATLKAMGYAPRYFVLFVVQESLYLAVLAFLPGAAAAAATYGWLGAVTGLPMRLSIGRAVAIFVLTLSMCVVSGLLAIRRLHSASPADLFS